MTGRTPVAALYWWGLIGLAAGALSYACAGCAPTSAPAKASAAARQVMASAVDASAHGWNAAAAACTAEADAGPAKVTMHQCYLALQPVHDAIIEAGVAVQVYSDVDAVNLPCLLADIATGLAAAGDMLAHPPQALHDAALIVNQFSVACVRPDAGKGAK